MNKHVTDSDIDKLKSQIDSWYVALPDIEDIPPIPPVVQGWSSGAFTMHKSSLFDAFSAMRGKVLNHSSMFAARETTTSLENTWWMQRQYTGDVPEISIGLPMATNGQSVAQDLSSSMNKIANAMKADGRLFYIRLGWEMNLSGWAWKVTDSNLNQWRTRWSQYYDIFKNVVGNKAQVGFNPNIGVNQSGLSGSINKAFVVGKVDWCGPDAYDCWPAFTTDTNVGTQLNRDQGLKWWGENAKAHGVKLALPEWGVASGSAWAGNQGNDNARYITEIRAWCDTYSSNLLFESYFNEQASYLKSDLVLPQNPMSRDRYRQLWGV